MRQPLTPETIRLWQLLKTGVGHGDRIECLGETFNQYFNRIPIILTGWGWKSKHLCLKYLSWDGISYCTLSKFGALIFQRRRIEAWSIWTETMASQIGKFMGSTWGPPGSCRSQIGPMLAPWTLLPGLQMGWWPEHSTQISWKEVALPYSLTPTLERVVLPHPSCGNEFKCHLGTHATEWIHERFL